MKTKKIISIVCLVCISFMLFANKVNKEDTTQVNIPEINILRYVDNLDSLVKLWYVNKSLVNDNVDLAEDVANDTIIPDYPDSVYISRLQSINSFIELPYNNIVRNFINVYTQRKREKIEIMLGLTDYYFPIFEEVLDIYNLPYELKYLAIIESALNPRALSRAGARGIWQFMYATAKLYNLEINSYVDERMDPVKASHAAAQYLIDAYNIYKDWMLAIAAYNCGPGNVNKAIRRSGGKTNYWDIYYFLPTETRGYVPAFIAAIYLMHFYKDHKLTPKKIDFPQFTDTLMVTKQLHLQQIAEVLDIDIQLLRDLNPQYTKDIIPAKNKAYPLKLPIEYSALYIDLKDSIYKYKDSIYFANNSIIIPEKTPAHYSSSVAIPKNSKKIYYTVKAGDNLGYVASIFNVSVNQLKGWNHLNRNLIIAGQKLVIYVPCDKEEKYKQFDNLSANQKQTLINPEVQITKENDEYIYYTVKLGDNIWEITRKFPGVTHTDIMKWNNITNSKITPGQVIKIKK